MHEIAIANAEGFTTLVDMYRLANTGFSTLCEWGRYLGMRDMFTLIHGFEPSEVVNVLETAIMENVNGN